MWRDLRYGLRQWRRKKLFGVMLFALLSIGIGANTLIFSFVNALLLKPLPVKRPDNLFLIEKTRERQVRPDTEFFYRQFEQVSYERQVFSAAVAEQSWSSLSFQPYSTSDSTRLITTQIVSPNYFSELGLRPAIGRLLTEDDAVASGEIPVVLSYQFWRSQFQRDAGAIGKTIRVKGYPFRVVGVVPEEFHSLDVERAPDVRFPIAAAHALTGGSVDEPAGEQRLSFQILVRLKNGVPLSQAAGQLLPVLQGMEADLWRDWWRRSSATEEREGLEEQIKYEQEYRLEFQSAALGISRMREQFSRAVELLMGAVVLLLLAVCANVAGLLLARAQERKQEIAVRLSMGASRLRLLRQLLTENLLPAIPGALFGTAFAYALAPWLVRLLPPPRGLVQYAATPQIVSVQPDVRVLCFAGAVSFFSVFLFGIAPGWQAARSDLNEVLKGSGRAVTNALTGVSMVALQFALAVVLLTASVAMLRTFWNLEHLNPGFDRAHVVEFTVDPQAAGYSGTRAKVFCRELREAARQLPGVASVSWAAMGVMRGIGQKTTVTPKGKVLPKRTFLNTSANEVTSDYFNTLGIPLLSGRGLDIRDLGVKPQRLVVNRAFADFFFPHEGNIAGKEIVQGVDGTKPATGVIVGMVGTAKYRSLREQDPPIAYSASDDGSGTFLYVRTSGDPARAIQSVRAVLRGLDPRVPLIEAFTLEQEVQTSLWQERLVTILAGFFGVVALLLSALGLYGTMTYSVARRARELGIRIAIGAQVWDIASAVCGRLFWSLIIGLAAGMFATLFLLRLAANLLFGVSPSDPSSLVTVVTALLGFSALAAAYPTHRAATINPSNALREE